MGFEGFGENDDIGENAGEVVVVQEERNEVEEAGLEAKHGNGQAGPPFLQILEPALPR